MKKRLWLLAGLSFLMMGCSEKPETATAAAPDAGPDNAMTRYAQNLANDEKRAQQVANKANAEIAREQHMTNQASNQSEQAQ